MEWREIFDIVLSLLMCIIELDKMVMFKKFYIQVIKIKLLSSSV